MSEKLSRDEREESLRAPEPESAASRVAQVVWIIATIALAVAAYFFVSERRHRNVRAAGTIVVASIALYCYAKQRNMLGDRSFD
jgi:hypothetical protein